MASILRGFIRSCLTVGQLDGRHISVIRQYLTFIGTCNVGRLFASDQEIGHTLIHVSTRNHERNKAKMFF